MIQKVTFKGQPIALAGDMPKVGAEAPPFALVGKDLSEVTRQNFAGKKLVMNIFVSVDTSVCATSVHRFYTLLTEHPEIQLVNISMDLPFAMGRFCSAEMLPTAEGLSAYRSDFGASYDYGLKMQDGPLKGLLARAVIVIDENNKVIYTQLVPEITQEPDYERVTELLKIKS